MSLCGQTFKEKKEHGKPDHKEALNDEVIGCGRVDSLNGTIC